MPAPVNQFKADLAAGKQMYGCWAGFADPYATVVRGTAGFDWLVIDGEHAPNDLRSITAQLQVLQPSASHPIVRLPMGEDWLIKQVLDVGAQSLLIPMVESGAQAEGLVRATRYPPEGIRGSGAALGRASMFSDLPDYTVTANAQICLLVQVETVAGMEALDDILAVEGIDGVEEIGERLDLLGARAGGGEQAGDLVLVIEPHGHAIEQGLKWGEGIG